MQNIYAPKPKLNNIPNELKSKPLWRPWVYTPPENENKKPGKKPLSAITLAPSNDVNNYSDCTDFETLKDMLLIEQEKPYEDQRFHGIGYTLDGSIQVVDLDHAISNEGEITSLALDLLKTIPGYVEQSVSGKGFHIFTKLEGFDKNLKERSKNLEIFTNKYFIAVTGDIDERFNKEIPVNPVSFDPIKKHLNSIPQSNDFDVLKSPDPKWDVNRIKTELLDALPKNLGYQEWLHVGMALHFQTTGSEEGFHLFDEFSANSENYPNANEPSTLDKWNSFSAKNNSVTIGTLISLKNKYVSEKTYEVIHSDKPLLSKIKDVRHEIKKIDWLVDGMIKSESLVMFAGAPSGGKTYLAIELFMAIASGKPFLGKHLTKQGDAVFIACEGRDSVLRRTKAWVNAKNNTEEVDNAYISRGEVVVTLPEHNELSIEFMANHIAKSNINPKLIVIDTMNFSLGTAKENDVNDMTDYFIKIKNNIIKKFGATVLLIHHTSKDNSDIRGSSSIRGALDSLFLVTQPEQNLFKVVNDKHKDRDSIPTFHLDGKLIDIELADGSIESNLVLYPSNIHFSATGLLPIQQRALEILEAKVGVNGAMKKSDLLAFLNDPKIANNAARDLYRPLSDKGYIEAKAKTITLLKAKDMFD